MSKLNTELKIAAYMKENYDKTIREWAEELGITHNKAAAILSKYQRLGLLPMKGHDSERHRKIAYRAMAKYQYEKLSEELALPV